jgi:hypothetical protein
MPSSVELSLEGGVGTFAPGPSYESGGNLTMVSDAEVGA